MAAVVAGLAVFACLTVVLLIWWVIHDVTHNDLPSCDAVPVDVAWMPTSGEWRTSDPFVLRDPTMVQVDAVVHGDNPAAILPSWGTIWVAPSDFDPHRIDEYDRAWEAAHSSVVPPATAPPVMIAAPRSELIEVGTGVNAINEQAMVPAGEWVLLTRYRFVGRTELRSPC